MRLEEYLAIPYVLRLESVPSVTGEWTRRASHPELPGCVVDGASPEEAVELLERRRALLIREALARGDDVPVPRPPLQCNRDWLLDGA